MATEAKQILERLDEIKLELDYIKDHMTDVDLVMTEEDVLSLKEAEEDLKLKKTKRI